MSNQDRWKDVDAALRRLAKEQCARDFEIGELLLAAEDTKPWMVFGYRSIYEYASRLFGWGYIATCERLRVANALCELPALAAELKSGRMTYSIVREATRIATPETEADWIAALTGKSVRDVIAKAARHKRGDRPEDRGDPGLVRHRMVLEFTPRQWAIVSARHEEMRKGDSTLTDEELICMLAQVEVPAENGTAAAAFKIQMRVEPDGTAFMEAAAGEQVEVSPADLEAAQCDAEVWQHRQNGPLKPVKRKAISAATLRELERLSKGKCECCGVRIKPQKHHVDLVSEGGSNDVSNLIDLCDGHHIRVHEGSLIIEGSRETGWIFKHADGSLYGGAVLDVSRLEASSQAFSALQKLGYPEALIKRVLASIRATSPDLSPFHLIKAALPLLQRKRYRLNSAPTPMAREFETPYEVFTRVNPEAPSLGQESESPPLSGGESETPYAVLARIGDSRPTVYTRKDVRDGPRGKRRIPAAYLHA